MTHLIGFAMVAGVGIARGPAAGLAALFLWLVAVALGEHFFR
jgi:hypothetical protein